MFIRLIIFTLASALCTSHAAPSKSTTDAPSSPAEEQKYLSVDEGQFVHPHFITIERFESLLKRAGELFHPVANFQVLKATASQSKSTQEVAVPYEQMQPPTEQPYNFYLPLFEYDGTKLDAKSRRMETIAPPPEPNNDQIQPNYYAAKPKKLPKKFSANTKHVNVKWLNALEKESFSGELPKAIYLLNDERNRINFDDSFFGVDIQVKLPDNEPHKDAAKSRDEGAQDEEFLNQNEEVGEEDLLAAAAAQNPQVNYEFGTPKAA